jgi:hypothetical protein
MKHKDDTKHGKLENDSPSKTKTKKRRRVELEPELEEIAAFWSAAKRFEMSRKFRRWARQLRVSGFILFQDAHPDGRPSMPCVAPRKARLN